MTPFDFVVGCFLMVAVIAIVRALSKLSEDNKERLGGLAVFAILTFLSGVFVFWVRTEILP